MRRRHAGEQENRRLLFEKENKNSSFFSYSLAGFLLTS
jgi:hypothetical protein